MLPITREFSILKNSSWNLFLAWRQGFRLYEPEKGFTVGNWITSHANSVGCQLLHKFPKPPVKRRGFRIQLAKLTVKLILGFELS